jgi:hypothetical protein
MVALSFAATLVTAFPAYAGPPEAAASVDVTAASHCARGGALIGSNCSYTTGMMARRVLEEGADWSYVGALATTANDLESMVAAPFTAGGHHVIANELVESLSSTEGLSNLRMILGGKLLEVDGVRYVVLTSYKVINT